MFVEVKPKFHYRKNGELHLIKSMFAMALPFLRGHWAGMTISTALSYLGAFFGVLAALGLASIFELIFNGMPSMAQEGEAVGLKTIGMLDLNNLGRLALDFVLARMGDIQDQTKLILWLCILMVVVNILRALIHGISRLMWLFLRLKFSRSAQNSFYVHLQSLSISFFVKQKAAELTTRLNTDLGAMTGSVISLLSNFVKSPVMMLIYCYLLLRTSPILTFVTLLAASIHVTVSYFIGQLAKSKVKARYDSFAALVATAQEALESIRIVKSFGADWFEANKFKTRAESFMRAEMKALLVTRETPVVLNTILSAISISMVAITGLLLLSNNHIQRQGLVMFLLVAKMTLGIAATMSRSVVDMFQASAAGAKVMDLWQLRPKVIDGSFETETFKEKIVLNSVDFTYGDEIVLKNINLEIKRGQVIAVVGPSGGGKSTFADLLLRLYDPTGGVIEMDGTDVKEFTQNSYRRLFGVVSQETLLFNDTVANNIAYGRADIAEEEIILAAEVANAHEFIMDLPEGYNTFIGDRGVRLSGGQCQRIAIARAIVMHPRILIFDEATSALDNESERHVQQAIDKVIKDCTAIIIAHRLSTVANADRIIVLDKGKIVEQGTHVELLAHKGLYNRLYNMQIRGDDNSAEIIDDISKNDIADERYAR